MARAAPGWIGAKTPILAGPTVHRRQHAIHGPHHLRPAGVGSLLLIASALAHLVVGAQVVVFGDLQFDRGVRKFLHGRDPSTLLESTRTLREAADFALVNLETPLCDSNLPSVPKLYSLRSDRSTARVLREASFTHAILANNHTMDRGIPGLSQTLDALRDAGIATLGASLSGDPCAPVVSGKGTDSVAFLAMVALGGIDGRHVCSDPERVRVHLAALRKRRIPSIVSIHWGTEYSPVAEPGQKRLALSLAKAGAGAVVGHHAHVVQSDGVASPSIVAGIPVWYGIGNFVFDQWEPWTRRAQVAEIATKSGKAASWRSIELVRDGPRVRVAKPAINPPRP